MSLFQPSHTEIERTRERQARLKRLGALPAPVKRPEPPPPAIKVQPSAAEEVRTPREAIVDLARSFQTANRVPITDTRIIQLVVADHFGLDKGVLLTRRRIHRIVFPRHVAMYLALKLIPRTSTLKVGRFFGGWDHSTVIHARRAIERRLADPNFRLTIEAIEAKITALKVAKVVAMRPVVLNVTATRRTISD